MEYKLLKPWLDLENNFLHEKEGEILMIENKERADYLVKLEIIEPVKADNKETDKKNSKKEK